MLVDAGCSSGHERRSGPAGAFARSVPVEVNEAGRAGMRPRASGPIRDAVIVRERSSPWNAVARRSGGSILGKLPLFSKVIVL